MILYPAIDLKNGKCVRLRQGDLGSAQVYAEDPAAQALAFAAAGATHLHLVDLDGAVAGHAVNAQTVRRILAATRLAVLRHLVPLDYTRGTRYRRDIGLPAAPLTHLAVAAELDRYPPQALGFVLTTLTRGQNHVVAAAEAAAGAIPA